MRRTYYICTVEGCGKKHHAHGLCSTHLTRFYRYGTVDAPTYEPPTCAVPGCGLDAKARGWCKKHYDRWSKHGTTADPVRTVRYCSVDGCDRVHSSRGLCETHYVRLRTRGTLDPNPQHWKTTSFEDRFWRRVNKTDTCWLWTGGCIGGRDRGPTHVYGEVWRDNVKLLTHRVSWEMAFGPIPDGLFVLHRCDTPLCVRPDHLFLGTQADNARDMWAKGRGSKPPVKKRRAA